jgi:hypothetical protein
MLSDWADVGATLVLGLAGLYIAHSYQRQIRLTLAEKRFASYARLWALTEMASPIRERPGGVGPLTLDERQALHDCLTHWHYANGDGILLERESRDIYLTAKHNLVCQDADLLPPSLAKIDGIAERRGSLSIRQLSLLRSQMRADLRIFARWYYRGLNQTDKEFLSYCRINLNKKPWKLSEPHLATAAHDIG